MTRRRPSRTSFLGGRAGQARVLGSSRHWPDGMWHGWYVMADRLPEGRHALEEAGAVIRAGVLRRPE